MNSSASYEIRRSDTEGYYIFTTRYGVDYSIGLKESSDWFGLPSVRFNGVEALHFGLDLVTPAIRAPFDPRIKATVTTFIINYLSKHPDHIFFFVYSDTGGKERQRRNVFDRWYTSSGQTTHLVGKTTQLIEDQEIHFLYRKDSPAAVKLLEQVEMYRRLPKYLINP